MSFPVLSCEDVRRVLAELPRLSLAHLPTPLDEAPRFAARIGVGRVLIKRDDCTGMLFGGNKTRHNEFLLADALRHQCDVVIWGAGIQSNNCRQTAAACTKLGLECRLFLSRTTHGDDLQGNLLLDHLVGAHVELVDAPMGEPMPRRDESRELKESNLARWSEAPLALRLVRGKITKNNSSPTVSSSQAGEEKRQRFRPFRFPHTCEYKRNNQGKCT